MVQIFFFKYIIEFWMNRFIIKYDSGYTIRMYNVPAIILININILYNYLLFTVNHFNSNN
jgi:hypothetical protein